MRNDIVAIISGLIIVTMIIIITGDYPSIPELKKGIETGVLIIGLFLVAAGFVAYLDRIDSKKKSNGDKI